MGIDLSDAGAMYRDLKDHLGHEIVVVAYGDDAAPDNIAIECRDCGTVLLDANRQPARIYTVEWDLSYTGGDYSNVGDFVVIEADEGETVEKAFERITGRNRMHIIHYEDKEAEDES